MADPATTPGTTPGTTPETAPGTTPAAWHAGVDAETIGHWQNSGWDIASPIAVATAATKAARDAAQFIGAPPSELLRMPKAGDEAGARAMWQRLGVPQDVNGYDLSPVKFADGSPLDDAFVAHFRNAALKLNIPKDQAVGLASEVVKFMEQAEGAETAKALADNAASAAALRQSWGKNWDVNMFVAKQAALKLGFSEAEVDGMQKMTGYAKTMETFRQMGISQGEGKFIEGGGPGGNGVFTKEQAVAKRRDLMSDSAWSQRYLAGGQAEKNEMTQLNTIIVGEDDTNRFRAY